jgi:predicted esterase YcpF (UPF0227 family)
MPCGTTRVSILFWSQNLFAYFSHPERYFAVIAKGDEVLDWKEMTGYYPGASVKLLPQGDHALSDYEQNLDEFIQFLELV